MSDRVHEYFAAEATEYLDQLETVLAQPGRPDLDQLLRLARGVRGSAQMAGADTLVEVAERLEEGVRSIQAGHVLWSEDVRALSTRTVADLKVLIRASSHWGRLEEIRVRSAIDRWNEVEPAREGAVRAGEGAAALPIESLFYDDAGPHVLSPEGDEPMNDGATMDSHAVPIESLLLDGYGALREALSLRVPLERAVQGIPGADREITPLLRELFDLIQLAAEGNVTGG